MEDPGVDGSIILIWILEKCNRSMNWIDLAQGRDRWRALLNATMIIGYNKMRRYFLSS